MESNIMSQFNFKDISKELEELVSCLDKGEMFHCEAFSLYESMSATEICDPKMDVKADLESCDSISKCLQSKRIKIPEELSIQELVGIFDDIMGKEMLWFKGNSLSQTIYTLIYLHDPHLAQKNKFLSTYLDSIHIGGFICYEMIRQSNYLRDDDYVPSVVSFSTSNKTEDKIVEELLELEYEISGNLTSVKKNKKNKERLYNEYDALDSRLKLRRNLLNIYILMIQKFSQKIAEEMRILINSCRKKIEIIKETLNLSADCSSYFSDSIFKSLLCHIPPRAVKTITKTNAIEELENFLNQLDFTIELSKQNNFYEILLSLENYLNMPKNILCHAYLDISLYIIPKKYFGGQDFSETILEMLRNFGLNVKEFINNVKFQEYLEKTVLVGLEYIAKYMRNKFRQQRDYSKLYQDLSILINESHETDSALLSKKENVTLIWCYDLTMKMMIKQLLLGFELELYQPCDYPYVLFYLDYFYGAVDNNNRNFITKFDKEFISAWQTKINLDKKKKKITDFQRKFFFESLFYKALQMYSKGLSRFSYFLLTKGIIKKVNTDETYENRFNNRFRIFDKCYFLKRLEYETFVTVMKEFHNEGELDNQFEKLKELFSKAQKTFDEISKEESFDNPRLKADAKKLIRLCILNSLAIAKYDKNKNKPETLKAVFKKTEHVHYHYIDFV